MSHAEPSGRVALLAGFSAAFIAVSFGYLHRTVSLDWPDIALDGPGRMLAYFVAGAVFQFGIPILCFAAFIFGASARRLWTTRLGLACAGAALVGYALYVPPAWTVANFVPNTQPRPGVRVCARQRVIAKTDPGPGGNLTDFDPTLGPPACGHAAALRFRIGGISSHASPEVLVQRLANQLGIRPSRFCRQAEKAFVLRVGNKETDPLHIRNLRGGMYAYQAYVPVIGSPATS